MSKWDDFRLTTSRLHSDFFDQTRYQAEFFDYTTGTYDPNTGSMSGQSRSSITTEDVELVPPSQDSSVDVDGTNFSWTTSIRFPESDGITGQLTPLGEDGERPTEVELTDQQDGGTDVYELHSYTTEVGSGLIMCRLVEQ